MFFYFNLICIFFSVFKWIWEYLTLHSSNSFFDDDDDTANNANSNSNNSNTNSNSNSSSNNSNSNSNSNSNTNTNSSNSSNRNASNSNALAKTGLTDNSGAITLIVIVCVISAIYSYKKVSDYKNL